MRCVKTLYQVVDKDGFRMSIAVNILGKYEMAYGTEVEVSYICPHCCESVTEIICFSKSIKNCVASVDDHECPECGEENDLEIDLY